MIKTKQNITNINYLFLDHDGVIVMQDTNGDLGKFFDPKCVSILNKIIIETNCELVVSSDWRNRYTLKNMGIIYEDSGIIKKPISYTPDLWTKNSSVDDLEFIRSSEISDWLNQRGIFTHWCAVDDMKLLLHNFVLVDPDYGLTNIIKNKVTPFLLK